MRIDRRCVLSGLGLALATAPSWAATPQVALSPEDQRSVASVVDYLTSLATARGRFVQTDARGSEAGGTFYLQRPGRARFDYDPPSGLAIASDGHTVSVVDRRLKTIRSYPLGMTPLALFLAKDIRLDRGVVVTEVTRSPGALTVVARDGHRRNAGRIALDFSTDPLALTGWTLTDARGGVVRIRLQDFGPSAPRDPAFFKLADPAPRPDPDSGIH